MTGQVPAWTVSTLSRKVFAYAALSAFGGLVLGALAKGGDKNKKGGGPASDALFSPLALSLAGAALVVTVVVLYLQSARLEGGADWIRRVRPNPKTQIHVSEAVVVTRTRPRMLKMYNKGTKELATLGFKITTADGRAIEVGEAGVHREARLLGIYELAMAAAVEHWLRQIAAGVPYAVANVRLFGTGLQWSNNAGMQFAEIAAVIVEVGTGVEVTIVDRMQRPGAGLPDDELLHRLLSRLGVQVILRRSQV